MKRTNRIVATFFAIIALAAFPLIGAAQSTTGPAGKLTVAVLDFDAGTADLGKQISASITAILSKNSERYTLVDRATLARGLQETELNLTGLIEPNQAIRVGQLVGARLLVVGRAFAMDGKTFIAAKIIGTETSLVSAIAVSADAGADVSGLVTQLANDVAKRIQDVGPSLVANASNAHDPLPALKERLSARALSKVTVRVSERHISSTPPAGVDPAVATELTKLLIECGFQVINGDDTKLADSGVELIIGGEALSEFAARIGNLISCSARLELTVTERKSGRVIFTDRILTRATDLSENIAGKSALQAAGHELGLKMLEKLAGSLPAKASPAPAAQ